jgi:hypothetical protein
VERRRDMKWGEKVEMEGREGGNEVEMEWSEEETS